MLKNIFEFEFVVLVLYMYFSMFTTTKLFVLLSWMEVSMLHCVSRANKTVYGKKNALLSLTKHLCILSSSIMSQKTERRKFFTGYSAKGERRTN